MKKFYLLFCALMAISMLSAQNVKEFPGVPRLRSVSAEKSGHMRAPLNEEKKLGTSMYATTWYDGTKRPSFIQFYSNKPTELNRINPINPADEHAINRMISGAWCEGEYYGYFMKIYGNAQWVIPYTDCFAKVDWATGTYESIADMSELNTGGLDNPNSWEQADALTSDPTTGKLYALIRSQFESELMGRAVSAIVEVDKTDGSYKEEGRQGLEEYYFSFAYDMDGQLWGLRWDYDRNAENPTPNSAVLVTLDKEKAYQETVVAKLHANGKNIIASYPSVISFDHTTGDLYCLLSDAEALTQYLATIDTKTAEVVDKGRIENGFSLATGLYIPYITAESRKAPAAVSNISYTYDANGENKVTLKWTNPSTTWDKTALTALEKVYIYRDEIKEANLVVAYDVTAGVGGQEEYTDDKAAQGKHTYYFVPANESGKGIAASWDAFVGHDVPDAPTGLYVETSEDKTSVTIEWSAPNNRNHGANGGWFDKESLKYDILRFPDNKLVAQDIKEKTFVDEGIETMQSYYYQVTAKNNDGTGNSALTERIIAGKSIVPPFSGNFIDKDFTSMWTVIDVTKDGKTFLWDDKEPGSGLAISFEASNVNDDYAISPEISMKEGTSYRIMFDVYFNWADDVQTDRIHDFDITIGKGATAEAQTTVVESWREFTTKVYASTVQFKAIHKATETGIYNVGYHFMTKNTPDLVALKKFAIEEIYEKDMKILSIDGTKEAAVDYAADYTVEVENYGNSDVTSYKVQTFRYDINGDVVVLGETAVDKKIVFAQKAKVKVTTKFDTYGDIDLYARVLVDGDQCATNDISKPHTVSVAAAGIKPIDKVATSGVAADIREESTLPISFFHASGLSTTQSIYKASDFKSDKNIKIERIAYKYRGENPVSGLSVKIYMGNIPQDNFGTFDDEVLSFIPTSTLTKVYEGPAPDLLVGDELMWTFDLAKPFTYDISKNLVIAVEKEGAYEDLNAPWPAFFSAFNEKHASSEENIVRSLKLNGKVGNPQKDYTLPELYYAGEFDGGVSVDNIEDTQESLWFNHNENRIMILDNNIVSVAVYDIAGRMMLTKPVADNCNAIGINLPQGIYVVKAISSDNSVSAIKINVIR